MKMTRKKNSTFIYIYFKIIHGNTNNETIISPRQKTFQMQCVSEPSRKVKLIWLNYVKRRITTLVFFFSKLDWMSHWFCLIFLENKQSSGQMWDREMINDEPKEYLLPTFTRKSSDCMDLFSFSVDLSKIHFFCPNQNKMKACIL